MKELEQKNTEEQPQPIGVQLHNELVKAKAYEQLQEEPQDRRKQTRVSRQTLLETFLTTSKSMNEIARETDELSLPGVRANLVTSLQRAFATLDPETQKQFGGSAENAIKAVIADPIKKEEKLRKFRESWKVEKSRETGKANRGNPTGNIGKTTGKAKAREISEQHKKAIIESNQRRGQQHREQKAQQAQAHTEHTVVDFTQPPQAQPQRNPQR